MGFEQYFIITGASGAGKSTLLEELRFLGYSVVAEAGRAVIRERIERGERVLPWIDDAAFIAEVLARSVRDHDAASLLKAPVFFDRAVPEARLHGVEMTPQYIEALERCRYNSRVFVTRPWAEIFVNDSERMHDYDTTLLLYEQSIAAYVEAGYELCYIPKGTVRERVEFMLAYATRGG